MKHYRYSAIDLQGRHVRGWMMAESEQALAGLLLQQGRELLTARVSTRQRKIAVSEKWHLLIVFCSQLEQLLQAGVPLLQALEELATHSDHSVFSSALQTLHHALQSGKLLSQAMQQQPVVFPPLVCQLVAAGERTGQLPEILGHLSHTLQWQAELRSQVRRGLIYPALLCVMVGLAAGVMLTFLVPQMAGFLNSLGQTLPWSTRTLLALSSGIKAYGLVMLIFIPLISVIVTTVIQRSSTWMLRADKLQLHLPVVGKLLHQLALARLCRYLGLMYQTGIPLLQALQWCQPLLNNRWMALALSTVEQRVHAGAGLASSFAEVGCFSPLMIRMIKIGETTGALDKTLKQLSAIYDHEVQQQLHTLLRLLEPVLTIILGAMLLFLMAAVMLPVYDSFSSIHY
ncbi:type II secretion system F family protein [Methylophilus aquaticus]|uniref:Type II secretion system F family protein n=1 Tax=Methylophilus aquaticus TaxID=1971610 RepID=A0ABT9JTI5_9PROT|nr:type II secretion system F family protein [Methylophilus aquaticus]MDP8567863.1 type II secretion system F family protein [Methylophilus aquaticus]